MVSAYYEDGQRNEDGQCMLWGWST